MGRLHVSIFSFDSRVDFQNGYVREELQYNKETTLKDIFQSVNPKNFGYQEFGINLDFIYCRINGRVIFGDMLVDDLVSCFGTLWTIDPLSKKHSQKDFLLAFDYEFARYQEFFRIMDFIAPSEREELKKYLPLNFVATCHDSDYYGDGFFLYIKWLLSCYPTYKHKLLEYVSGKGGVFEYVPTASFFFPFNQSLDIQIQSLQSMLVAFDSPQMHLREFGVYIDKKYGFTCTNRIVGFNNEIVAPSPFVQNILQSDIVK